MKGLIVLAVGALTIASIAGCGDDETAAASLTKAQFIKRADAICTRGDERFQTLYVKYVRESGLSVAKGKRTVAEGAEITE